MPVIGNTENFIGNNENFSAAKKTANSLCNLYNNAIEKPNAKQGSLFTAGLAGGTVTAGILKNSGAAIKYGALGLAGSALFYSLSNAKDASLIENGGAIGAGVSTATILSGIMSKNTKVSKFGLLGLGLSGLAYASGKFDKKEIGKASAVAGIAGSGASIASLAFGILSKKPKLIVASLTGLATSIGASVAGYKLENSISIPDKKNTEIINDEIRYDIENYFKDDETRNSAKYADLVESGGNGNNMLDGKEIDTFKQIVKHKYSKFEYDFDSWNEQQTGNLANKKDYCSSLLYEKDGSKELGTMVSNKLNNRTSYESYIQINKIIDRISEFPVTQQKYNIIKDFLLGYQEGNASEGIFEQTGSEYNSGIRNENMLKLMRNIMDVVPDEKKNTNEYLELEEMYDFYDQKPVNETFASPSFMGGYKLANLDKAVLKLFNITTN